MKNEWPWVLAFAGGVILYAMHLLWVFYLAVALLTLLLAAWAMTARPTKEVEDHEELSEETDIPRT